MTATAKSRIYPAVIAVLLFVIAAIAYKFIVAGSTEKTEDGRLAILLEPGERALMLREMRAFVAGLQLMSDALSRDDMKGVAKVAREMGIARAHDVDVPLAMMGKLPLGFKTLAFSVHRGFDTIAIDAEKIGVPKHTLGQLSDVLQKCVACHSSYQVKTATTGQRRIGEGVADALRQKGSIAGGGGVQERQGQAEVLPALTRTTFQYA